MDQIFALLAAFGLGSVVTALVQSALTNRTKRFDRIFAEKQAAYVGLLEARDRHAAKATGETTRNLAYWQARCNLVGSDAVLKLIGPMVGASGEGKGRASADDKLRRAMRRDLKIPD